MARKQRSTKHPSSSSPASTSGTASVSSRSGDGNIDPAVISILKLPRLVRMILIAVPALASTIIFTPVVDAIYLRFFFTLETRLLPSIITSGLALTVYLVGWVLVVGTAGEKPQEFRAIKWYLIASIFLMLFATLWFAYLLFDSMQT